LQNAAKQKLQYGHFGERNLRYRFWIAAATARSTESVVRTFVCFQAIWHAFICFGGIMELRLVFNN